MILIKGIVLVILGFIFGFMIAAGLFAFITIIGVITRLAIRTNTAYRIRQYEDIVVLGTMVCNIILLFRIPIPIGQVGLIIFGFFSGCFVGCLAMALEEVLQIFPIIARRMNLTVGVPFLIFILAISKGLGVFYQLFIKG